MIRPMTAAEKVVLEIVRFFSDGFAMTEKVPVKRVIDLALVRYRDHFTTADEVWRTIDSLAAVDFLGVDNTFTLRGCWLRTAGKNYFTQER